MKSRPAGHRRGASPVPPSMRRVPALLLLLALVGGLGASSVHGAHHAAEWAEAQHEHAADHHTDGDHAGTPCVDGDAHGLGCAVCSGLGGAVAEAGQALDEAPDAELQAAAVEAHAAHRRAVAPARGPPAVA